MATLAFDIAIYSARPIGELYLTLKGSRKSKAVALPLATRHLSLAVSLVAAKSALG
jgi:hypothetical protein